MTREQAEAEAVKREAHKSKHLSHMRWEAAHTSTKGWHVALVECPFHAAQRAHSKARDAFRSGDFAAFREAAVDALMANVRDTLASVDGRRMAETALAGSGRSPTSAVGEAETPTPSKEQPQ